MAVLGKLASYFFHMDTFFPTWKIVLRLLLLSGTAEASRSRGCRFEC